MADRTQSLERAQPALETISISDFRSIRGTIALPLNAPVVLLHGTNGAGKTTVISALELALTGGIADVRPVDRKHLINQEAKAATVALTASDGSANIRIEAGAVTGDALLGADDSRFFTERCYLAQRTLGQLLEIYQAVEGQRDSALTRFVKELLGLDELDFLIEGLDAVRDKRLVKKLVPEYGEAEKHLLSTRGEIRSVEDRFQALRRAVLFPNLAWGNRLRLGSSYDRQDQAGRPNLVVKHRLGCNSGVADHLVAQPAAGI